MKPGISLIGAPTVGSDRDCIERFGITLEKEQTADPLECAGPRRDKAQLGGIAGYRVGGQVFAEAGDGLFDAARLAVKGTVPIQQAGIEVVGSVVGDGAEL